MSKAFTKDDDAGELPVVVSRRAPLPAGVSNYVTQPGLAKLLSELADLQREQFSAGAGEQERARALGLHAAKLAELEQRIASAELVDSAQQPKDEVRFGATVVVQNAAGSVRRYRIVGVDEADAARSAIAFVAPLARSLLGKRVGDVATLTTPAAEDELEILAISYD